MPNALIDVIDIIPSQLVFAYALTRMLSVRRPLLYWALEFGTTLLLAYYRSSFGVEFRFLAAIPLMLYPVILSEGRLAQRVMAVVLAYLVLFFAELPGGALWVAMTGTPIADYGAVREHFGAFVITHAAHLVLLALLLAMLCMLFNRLNAREREKGAWLPVLFLGVQLALACLMILLSLGYAREPMRYYAITVVLSVVGFAADLLLFSSMERFAQKRNDDARALMLEKQLECYLGQYACFVRTIERTAQLRHDLGNNVQVVLALTRRGLFREAREHLGFIRGELVDPREDEGVAL